MYKRTFQVILTAAVLLFLPVSCLDLDVSDEYESLLEKEVEALAIYMEENYPGVEPLPSGLYHLEIVTGTGDSAVYGDVVTVDYTGYFLNGEMFDTSMDTAAIRGDIYSPSRTYEPMVFQLGYSSIIYGFQEGLTQVREGGHSRVFFPSNLGYGRGTTGIPTNTTLIFDLYLREIQ